MLIEEFEKPGLDILAVTQTKKKDKGITKLKYNYILIYSRVDNSDRARAGVGCIINKKLEQAIKNWNWMNERLLIVQVDEKNRAIGKYNDNLCNKWG